MAFVSVIFIQVGIVLHELGHAVAILGFGGKLVGAVFSIEKSYVSWYPNGTDSLANAVIYFAGPFTSITYGVVCFAIGRSFKSFVSAATGFVGYLSVGFGFGCLLPLPGMDGEKILTNLFGIFLPGQPSTVLTIVLTFLVISLGMTSLVMLGAFKELQKMMSHKHKEKD
jgi:Zn-dependent protease